MATGTTRKFVRLRADDEYVALCKTLAKWRNKANVSRWLKDFVASEKAAYDAATKRKIRRRNQRSRNEADARRLLSAEGSAA